MMTYKQIKSLKNTKKPVYIVSSLHPFNISRNFVIYNSKNQLIWIERQNPSKEDSVGYYLESQEDFDDNTFDHNKNFFKSKPTALKEAIKRHKDHLKELSKQIIDIKQSITNETFTINQLNSELFNIKFK